MAVPRRRDRGGLDAWPGYVDALSTLLMVLIFVLLVFVLAQGFLSVALSGRDRALERLNRQVAELSDLLALEQGRGEEQRADLARAEASLAATAAARDAALAEGTALREARDRGVAARDAALSERDRLAARLADLELAARGGTERAAALEVRLAEALARAEAAGGDAARVAGALAEGRREAEARRQAEAATLAEARGALAGARGDLEAARREAEALRREAAALDRTVRADRETLAARLSDLARLSEQARALTALRDQLEREARAAEARAGAEAEARRQAEAGGAEAVRLGEGARAQVALLTRQIEELRAQLGRVAAALGASEASGRDKDAQIAGLGQRLNLALAARVEELERYRSDFFGRLRDALGERPELRVVGDRFVFQSEVLFPSNSAELSERGQEQLRELAVVLRDIAGRIPPGVAWVLRVDGHADRAPVRGGRFGSNWELSAARAIAVARLLIGEGLPADRVAAAAFGDNQPLDPGDGPEARARNRRIELRLTDR